MNFKNSLREVYNKEREVYDALYNEMIAERDEIYGKLVWFWILIFSLFCINQ